MVTWTVWKEGEYSNQMLGKQFHDASEGIITSFGKISKISGESKETPIRSLLASAGAGVGVGSTSGEQVGEVCLCAAEAAILVTVFTGKQVLEDCLSLKALTSLLFSSRLLVLCKKPVAQEAGSEEGQRTPSLTGLAAGPG